MKHLKTLILLAILFETTITKPDLTLMKQNSETITIGDCYYHYRNPEIIYTVLFLSVDVKNKEQILVNYQVVNNPNEVIWTCSLEDFLSLVEVNGANIQKFTKTHRP